MSDRTDKPKKLERRDFLKKIGGIGIAGLSAGAVGCGDDFWNKSADGEGWMPAQYNDAGKYPPVVRGRVPIDPKNPSIIRDDRKCILCGQCIEACQAVQAVYGYYTLPILNDITCVNCGQCTLWCPTAAITEVDDTQKIFDAIADPNIHVIVQTAPSTRVALGEEFGMPPGSVVEGKQTAALKALGFDGVFDTNFTADLTIMEEGTEFIQRVNAALGNPLTTVSMTVTKDGQEHTLEIPLKRDSHGDHGDDEVHLPQFTSCSPGWVKFCEYFYPEFIPHLSSAKSPQQMLGALAKTYYAKTKGIDPKNILSVSIMPCTAKKFECQRPEHNDCTHYNELEESLQDVDFALTTRELARMIKAKGIDLNNLEEARYDSMMGEGTGAAVIFGASGGVMEAAVRSAFLLITGQNPPEALLNLTPVRGIEGNARESAIFSDLSPEAIESVRNIKVAELDVPGIPFPVRVAVSNGLSNGRALMDILREDKRKGLPPRFHFVEFMSCPGGCIGGGGQPRTAVPLSDDIREKRIKSIYDMDVSHYPKRLSHENQEVLEMYVDFLHYPTSHVAHELLHTGYTDRSNQLKALEKEDYPEA